MAKRDIDVIIAGHVCLDLIPGFGSVESTSIEQVFSPGRLVEVDRAILSTGGPVSNTGISLAKQGMKVSMMAKVGGDQFGRLTLEQLRQWADCSGVSISESESSSYTIVIAPPEIDRIFFHCPGTNHTFSAEDIDYDLCERSKVFHLGYPPLMRSLYQNQGEQLVEIFRRVKQRGAMTSLDMALPDPQSEAGRIDWRVILEKVLPYIDFFHPSAEEGLYMVLPDRWKDLHEKARGNEILDLIEGEDFSALSKQILDWGAAGVTVKSGHRGFYLHTAGPERIAKANSDRILDKGVWSQRQLWIPAYRIENIASATGAGDASLAGFIGATLRGLSPEQCIAAAIAVSSQNLQALDATSGIQDWPTTLAIMEDRKKSRQELPQWKDWEFDSTSQLGYGPQDH